MKLNLNMLEYDEESETYIEKVHQSKIHQEPQSNKFHDGYLSWCKRCGNKRQDDIKRKIRQARRFVIAMREI